MKQRTALMFVFALMSLSSVAAVVPGPPQNLVATVNGNTVTLTWQAPSTSDVPTSYIVQAALSPGGAVIAAGAVNGTTIRVTAVPNGVYYVRVVGINADGVSTPSNEVIVVVPGGGGGCITPPDPPTNLTGSVSGNTVLLLWEVPVRGCAATSYVVQAGSAPGLSNLAVANVGATTTLTASAPPGTYYVRVLALNAFGGSVASNEIIITVGNPCQAPASPPLMVTAQQSGNNVSINWFSPGGAVTGYVVEAGSAPGAANLLSTMTAGTNYVWSNAPAGTVYIRVRAMNSCGPGPASSDVAINVTGTA